MSAVEVVAVFGPTASGKSAVAEEVARVLRTEVVSADAMQVYRELPILTNQPATPTRLVAIRSVTETMSVGAYAALAHAAVDELVHAHRCAVVAGGTGLYLRAALCDLALPPRVPDPVRRAVTGAYDADPAAAYDRLCRVDPVAAARIHINDRRRVIRALELAEVGESLAPAGDRLWSGSMRRPTLIVGLDVPPAELERRIRDRTAAMFDAGVVNEVRAALQLPVSHTAVRALGLDEIAGHDRDAAYERIVVRTRRLAAYQRKWMRRIPDLRLLDGMRAPHDLARQVAAWASGGADAAPSAIV